MQVNGGAYFDLEVGDYKEFLSYDDVLYCEMKEFSGCARQIFKLSFRLFDEKIKRLFTLENNTVIFKFGSSKSSAETHKLYVTEHKENQDASGLFWNVNLVAIKDPTFYIERRSDSFTGTSLKVMEDLSKQYLGGFETDVKSVIEPETCTWVRKYQSCSEFLRELWTHMYIGEDSCPVIYIDRKNRLHLKDLKIIKQGKPTFKFTAQQPNDGNTLQYLNNFKPCSYKFNTNTAVGYGSVINIEDATTGKMVTCIPENKPDIASTKKVEKLKPGPRFINNKTITKNTHPKYVWAHYTNVARLTILSSIIGELIISGNQPQINILDLVEVDDGTKVHSGYYIVNTKVTYFSYNTPVMTRLTVCRDNKNRIEDSDIDKETPFKIANKTLSDINQFLRNARRMLAFCKKAMDGTLVNEIMAYTKAFKYNLLSSIVFAGVNINLNSKVELMQSMTALGNSLVNKIIDRYIPYPYNYVLRDYAIYKPSLSTLMSRLLAEFGPSEIRYFLIELTGLLADITGLSNSVTKDNEASLAENTYNSGGYGTGQQSTTLAEGLGISGMGGDMNTQTNTERIQVITDEFVDNTEGADIPIPVIELDESESLLNDSDLKDLIADKVIEELANQGYLKGMDADQISEIREAMLGTKDENGQKKQLSSNTINMLRTNTGEMLYCRYWGTFKNPEELTNFAITNSFKDIYLTAPTTKIINALKGARIFIAYPQLADNLIFYINNEEVEVDEDETSDTGIYVLKGIDLGLYNLVGKPLLYNIYMSNQTFNSNSVVLEVREKS